MSMLVHPFRTLFILLLVGLGVVAYRLATADEGGVYDPESAR